jgi:plastocyanin
MLVVAAVALAVLAAACGSSGHRAAGPSTSLAASPSTAPPARSAATIAIKNFAFLPADLTVSPGATVTVRNEDSATHTITANSPHDKVFDTGNVNPGATATFKAPMTAGSYSYICEIHQFMHGTLTVS